MFKSLITGWVWIALVVHSFQGTVPRSTLKKVIKVFKFAPCDPPSNPIMKFNTSTLFLTGGVEELNIVGFVNITQDISAPIFMSISTLRCDMQGFNCENYFNLVFPDCCTLLHIPFFKFLDGFRPEIKTCPIKKTVIQTDGVRYSMAAWMHAPMNYRYVSTCHWQDKDSNTVMCFNMDWAIISGRGKSSITKKIFNN